jgi:hypothetical protein
MFKKLNKTRKGLFCLNVVAGLTNIIVGFLSGNIFEIILGLMFFAYILDIFSQQSSDDLINLMEKEIELEKKTSYVIITEFEKAYKKNNEKLLKELFNITDKYYEEYKEEERNG